MLYVEILIFLIDIVIDFNVEVISGSMLIKCKNRIGKFIYCINVVMVLFLIKLVIKELINSISVIIMVIFNSYVLN